MYVYLFRLHLPSANLCPSACDAPERSKRVCFLLPTSRCVCVCVCVCVNGSGVLLNAQGHTCRSDNGVCVNFTGSVGSPRGVSILALIAKRTKSVTAAESGRVSERDCHKLLHSFSVTLTHFVSLSLSLSCCSNEWPGLEGSAAGV